MKKTAFRLFLAPALLLTLAGCGERQVSSSSSARTIEESSQDSSSEISSAEESSGETLSSLEESSSEEASSEEASSAPKEKTVADLTEEEYKTIPEIFVSKLESYSSYKAVTSGVTKATVIGITTDQSIEVTAIKGEYSYLNNGSHSNLVNTVHKAYFHNQKACFRDSDKGDYTLDTMVSYLETYGVDPFGHALEGYKIEEEDILSVTKVESQLDHKFKISFNTETCTAAVGKQMKKFGDLKDVPAFSRIDITVTLKNDFTPVQLELDSEYKAKKAVLFINVDTDCHQTYTVTYGNIGEAIEIPGLQEVREGYDF